MQRTIRPKKCRVCGDSGLHLTQYAIRRFAHWDCGVATWGNNFIRQVGIGELVGYPDTDPKRDYEEFISSKQRPHTLHTTKVVHGEIVGPNDAAFDPQPK